MGNCVAATTPEEREAKQRSANIDKDLRVAAKEYENTIKILLLGELRCRKRAVLSALSRHCTTDAIMMA